jgi:hypothetical protein
MINYALSRRRHVLLPLAILGATCLAARALTIDGQATAIAGGFHYEFTINNNGPDDVAIVSIPDAPASDPLIAPSLTVPAGFLGNYDSGLGIVDFIGDSDLFTLGTVKSGFSFDSSVSPAANFSFFEALTIGGDFVTGPINFRLVGVPDGGSTLLCAFIGLLALGITKLQINHLNKQTV